VCGRVAGGQAVHTGAEVVEMKRWGSESDARVWREARGACAQCGDIACAMACERWRKERVLRVWQWRQVRACACIA